MDKQPLLIIFMGVSGSGKTCIGQQVAQEIGGEFYDADDFHSGEAKMWMASGNPLTDDMREPWLARIFTHFNQEKENNKASKKSVKHYVLAYSGLKHQHREAFRNLDYRVRFIHLHGSYELISERLQNRENHFFNATLLKDQFDVLQTITPKELTADTIELEITPTSDDICTACITQIVKWSV